MDVRNLKTFVALAEARTVTRTAERLDYAPSSIAAHVHALEQEVGVALVERIGRGIALTEAGRAFLVHAKRIVDAERSAIADVRAAVVPASAVSLGSAASLASCLLPRILARARLREPNLSVSTRHGSCCDQVAGVRDGELDLALTIERRGEMLDHLRDESLATEELSAVPIAVVVAPQHRLASLTRVAPADFTGETLLDTEPGCSYREAFAALLDEAGVRIGARLDFDNFEAIRQLVRLGAGAAILPQVVVDDELAAGTLVELPIRPPGEFVIVVTWRPATVTAPVQALLNAAREEGKALLPTFALGARAGAA